jgi:amidase
MAAPVVWGAMPDATALGSMDAVETAERVARKELSVGEVVEAAISRAERAAHLGAIVCDTFARARERQTASGVLAAVPTFIKDLNQVRGVPTTWGSRAAGHYVSRRSEPFIARFERTGVVMLGKSATPELGLTATTEPLGRSPCRNPWDPTRSAGGSSGGAGCLVAAGVVPIAHASDGGGSIRIPAACCGLVGMKPSRGRIDIEGSGLLPVNIATHGVVTRTVRDTVAFYDAVAADRSPIAPDRRSGLRIGLFVDAPTGTPVHPETRAAVLRAGQLCEALGHRVTEIPCPFDAGVIDDFLQFWGLVAWLQWKSARLMLHRRFDSSNVEPWTAGMARTFSSRPSATFAAIRRLRRFARTYAGVMRSHDVLLSPTTAEPALALGQLATDLPFETVFERLRSYVPFTPIHNAAGAPAISLPLGQSGSGMPIGVQLAAAPGDDRTLLELALALEQRQPWTRTAPPERWVR